MLISPRVQIHLVPNRDHRRERRLRHRAALDVPRECPTIPASARVSASISGAARVPLHHAKHPFHSRKSAGCRFPLWFASLCAPAWREPSPTCCPTISVVGGTAACQYTASPPGDTYARGQRTRHPQHLAHARHRGITRHPHPLTATFSPSSLASSRNAPREPPMWYGFDRSKSFGAPAAVSRSSSPPAGGSTPPPSCPRPPVRRLVVGHVPTSVRFIVRHRASPRARPTRPGSRWRLSHRRDVRHEATEFDVRSRTPSARGVKVTRGDPRDDPPPHASAS